MFYNSLLITYLLSVLQYTLILTLLAAEHVRCDLEAQDDIPQDQLALQAGEREVALHKEKVIFKIMNFK